MCLLYRCNCPSVDMHSAVDNQVSAYFPSAPASPAGCQPSLEKKEKRKRNSHLVENVDSHDAGIRPSRGWLLASPPPTFLIQWGFFQEGGQRDRRKGQNQGHCRACPLCGPSVSIWQLRKNERATAINSHSALKTGPCPSRLPYLELRTLHSSFCQYRNGSKGHCPRWLSGHLAGRTGILSIDLAETRKGKENLVPLGDGSCGFWGALQCSSAAIGRAS